MSDVTSKYRVRRALPVDPPRLPEIEAAAGQVFAEVGLAHIAAHAPTSIEDHEEARLAGRLWVVADEADVAVGFALLGEVDGQPHLEELAVHPDHARLGLGGQLVESICHWARSAGYRELTLTTFLAVPWNAPYYERLGFQSLEASELSAALAAVRQKEDEHGLPARDRVCMRRLLGPPDPLGAQS